MTLFQLEKKAMYLEGKLQDYLRYDKFIGKGSRVDKLFGELNNLWKEISFKHRNLK
jgi:hypothetical protein